MDEQSGETEEEEATGEGTGESKMDELLPE